MAAANSAGGRTSNENAQPRTLGFSFAQDRPVESLVEEFGPALGVGTGPIEAVFDAIQRTIEAQAGPLIRAASWSDADVIVEIGGSGPVGSSNMLRFAAPNGRLVVTGVASGAKDMGLVHPATQDWAPTGSRYMLRQLIVMGLFDPSEPTVVGLADVMHLDTGISELFVSRLNPFGQDRKVVARCGRGSEQMAAILPSLADHDGAPFLATVPSLLIFKDAVRNDPLLAAAATELVRRLVQDRAQRPLDEIVADFRTHLGRPWQRIGAPGGSVEPERTVADSLLLDPFDDWVRIMGDPAHVDAEVEAIRVAWDRSIVHFGGRDPTLPFAEVEFELGRLVGFPSSPSE